jgi:hypothetical protein
MWSYYTYDDKMYVFFVRALYATCGHGKVVYIFVQGYGSPIHVCTRFGSKLSLVLR